jgi:hypothetical protein
LSNDTIEVETTYHPNYVVVNDGFERRRIQAPPIAENFISHSPGRDNIIFDQNDFAWTRIK